MTSLFYLFFPSSLERKKNLLKSLRSATCIMSKMLFFSGRVRNFFDALICWFLLLSVCNFSSSHEMILSVANKTLHRGWLMWWLIWNRSFRRNFCFSRQSKVLDRSKNWKYFSHRRRLCSWIQHFIIICT